VTQELGAHAAFPHARLADQRHQLARTLLRRPVERPDQERLLQIPSDERRPVRADDVPPELGPCPHRPEDRERFRLALDRDRVQRLVLEHPLRLPVGLLRHRDRVHRRRALEPRGRIDHVAGDEPLAELRPSAERDYALAGVDADAHLQAEAGVRLVQLADRLENPKAGTDRPLRVVLVRDRRAKDGHHRIADELLYSAAEPLDLHPHPGVIRTQPRTHILGVDRFRCGREPDEIAEKHRDNLPLFERRRRRRGSQRRAAERAECKLARKLLATSGTRRHRASVRRPARKRSLAYNTLSERQQKMDLSGLEPLGYGTP